MAGSTWEAATRRQYDDETNLAARQALFEYLIDATPLAAPLGDLASLAGQRVLDVGCGNGKFLAAAVDGGVGVVGCDLSIGMVQAARDTSSAPVLQADAHRLPVATGTIDVILALWMLYHVDDKPRALAEFARVLRSGGQLVASTNSGDDGDIGQLICAGLSAVLGRHVDEWHAPLSFTAENGAATIAAVFGGEAVERHPFGTTFAVDDPAVLVGYAGSMLGPMHEHHGQFDDRALLRAVGERCERAIADEGSIRIVRSGAVFIAHR